jgi:hypothetical protein
MDRQLADGLNIFQPSVFGEVDLQIRNRRILVHISERQPGQFRAATTVERQHQWQPVPGIVQDFATGSQAAIDPGHPGPDRG